MAKRRKARFELDPLIYSDQRRNKRLLAQNKSPQVTMSATNVYELTYQLPYKQFRSALAMTRWKTNIDIERERNIEEEEKFMKIASFVNEIDLNLAVKTVSRPSNLKRAKNSFQKFFTSVN